MSDGAQRDAVAAARAELDEAEGVFGPDHPHATKLRIKLAEALNSAGRHTEELPVRERVLADLMAQHGADHNDTAVAAHNYGYCLYANDRPDEGVTYIERARRDIAPFVKPQGPALFFLCRNLATVYQAANRTTDAIALLEEITDEQRDLTVVEASALRRVRVKLTELYRDVTGPGAEQARTKGEALWQLIMRKQEESAGPDDPETLRELNLFAVWYAKRTSNARPCRSIGASSPRGSGCSAGRTPRRCSRRSNLGICHAALGEREAAVKLLEPLYEQRMRLLGEEHEDTLDTLDRLAVNLYHTSSYQEAAKHFERLVETSRAARRGGRPGARDVPALAGLVAVPRRVLRPGPHRAARLPRRPGADTRAAAQGHHLGPARRRRLLPGAPGLRRGDPRCSSRCSASASASSGRAIRTP